MLLASAVIIAVMPTKLGLDLKGGIELVYQAQPTADSKVTPEAVSRSIDVIRNRVDQLGVAEPEIQQVGSDQISVGLPGIKDLDRAKRNVGSTASLQMYDFAANVIPENQTDANASSAAKEQARAYSGPTAQYDAIKAASKQKPVGDKNNTTSCATPDQPEKCGQYYLFNKNKKLIAGPDISRKDLLSQFNGKPPKGAEVIEVPYGTIVVKAPVNPDNKNLPPSYFVLKDNPEIKGTQIKDPKPGTDTGPGGSGGPVVSFQFKNGGADQFQKVTKRLAQRALTDQQVGDQPIPQTFATVLDGEIKSRASVDPNQYPDGIDGRTGAQISGLSTQEAQDLAQVLKTGALPVNLKPISQVQVSASLGKQALRQGLLAGVIGLLIVALFLLAFYRLLGVIAVLALIVYGVIFFALIKLIPITLTLPGIAGLILTIGVAADSNIVIFERIKEELRAGKSTLAAMATGYSRGIRTIVDANVVTLITAFILFILATGGVRGFALTLLVGTIVSFITAVLFTQAVLGTMGRSKILNSPAALGAGEKHRTWKFDFMGKSRYFFATSGCILLIGSVALATKGLNFGIDFESGTRVTATLEKPASVEKVRDAISPLNLNDAKIQQGKEQGKDTIQIGTGELGPGGVKRLQDEISKNFAVAPEGFSSESIGPTFGRTVAKSAIYAIIFSLLAIMGYIALRFEFKFAVPVIIAVFHDILITTGVYSLLGRDVTTSTVAALLTILGYSLYDTVIVFDRVRENTPRMPRAAFSQIVNRSMSEVLTRSLATSFCTMLPVLALLIFGGQTLQDFAFALLVGIASGAYSSIFIASPVLTESKEREPAYRQRRRRILDEFGYIPAYAVVAPAGTAVPAGAAVAAPAAALPEIAPDLPAPEAEPLDSGLDDDRDGDAQPETPEAVGAPDGASPITQEPGGIAAAPKTPADSSATARPPKSPGKKRSTRASRRKHGRKR
jgi:SecD/SecF fusion protein